MAAVAEGEADILCGINWNRDCNGVVGTLEGDWKAEVGSRCGQSNRFGVERDGQKYRDGRGCMMSRPSIRDALFIAYRSVVAPFHPTFAMSNILFVHICVYKYTSHMYICM